MPNAQGRTTEFEMSTAVLRILRDTPGGWMNLDDLRNQVPGYTELTEGDRALSDTRPGEALWEQLLRNIQSHKENPNNFINLGYLEHVDGGGYAIPDAGREFLESLEEEQ